MRIGLDAHFLKNPYSGNGVYTASLLTALRRIAPEYHAEIVAYGPSLQGAADDVSANSNFRFGKLGRMVFETPKMLKQDRIDIYHSQYTGTLFSQNKKTKHHLTIHDAAFARKGTSDYSRLKVNAFSYFASRADVITTVSHSSRADLEQVLRGRHPEIEVIPNGHDLAEPTSSELDEVSSILEDYDPPYVLYVGRMSKRKRVPLAIQGYSIFRKNHGGTLVLVGSDDDDSNTINELVQGRSDILRLRGISEGEKTALFSLCNAFIYLSDYEGFGLPVVESLHAGLPTIIANTPALREVSQGTAIVVGSRMEEVADAIWQCVYRPEEEKIKKGKLVASQFTWDNAARQTFNLYQRLLGH